MAELDPNATPDPNAGDPAAGSDAKPPAAPAFDPEMVKGAMTAALADFVSKNQAPPPAPPPPRPPSQGPSDPLTDVVIRAAAPALVQNAIASANATDLAMFYMANPKAVKHRAKIEAKVSESLNAGVVVGREDVYKWLQGADFKTFVDEEIAERLEKSKAQLAETVGGGSSPRGTLASTKDPYLMDDKELETVLGDIPF